MLRREHCLCGEILLFVFDSQCFFNVDIIIRVKYNIFLESAWDSYLNKVLE